MAITTKAKVKEIYSISVTTYDDAIDARIPEVAELISEYCRTAFISTSQQRLSTDKGFEVYDTSNVSATGKYTVDSSGKTITSSTAQFSDFQVGDDIVIVNSIRNSGLYTITVKTDTVITVAEDIKDELSTISIYLIDYPVTVSGIAAKMVGWDVLPSGKKMLGLSSQTIGTWTGSKEDITIGGIPYPTSVAGGINLYRLMRSK